MSSALETLRRDFGGDIIEPGGAGYESASRTLLASGNPAHVLRPGSVGDVQAGIRFAASTGLLLSVRGGGHGFAGFGTNGGGVVIDLSQLANVEITDKERYLVRIGGAICSPATTTSGRISLGSERCGGPCYGFQREADDFAATAFAHRAPATACSSCRSGRKAHPQHRPIGLTSDCVRCTTVRSE